MASELDGLIVRQPECHCFECQYSALGLDRRNPQRDLKERGFVRINRRWHCADCAASKNGGVHG